ncbi:division/cell wall cluster transcriptional repressor MraZ [Neptunicoccus cionae]|uniref:division/cell wall cluster transcriptional repressor MraZ n=1 Tax=Neptunicoccus cionae TaxID=2035344 RepID=UPI000C78B525|nr:division/cell wall cluster transcriptional repressor MraZ [Amylibacter cionae]PLS23501.1 transcriptional regulator MraZ [Amylibacter cionae]
MARRFRGESVHKVDAKGRVSIPAAFRRVLEEGDPDWEEGQNPNLVLVYGGKARNFIEGYTMTSMEEVDDKIAALPRGSKRRRALEHMFSGQSVQMSVDETGRLVLSPKLRSKIGISNEATFVATGDTFQIWEPSAYEEHAAALEDWMDEEDEDFDPLILLDMETAEG